jgi:hypothetical protein
MLTRKGEAREVEDYPGWPRLELLAFDARLAEVPQALPGALWEAIDRLPRTRTFNAPASTSM